MAKVKGSKPFELSKADLIKLGTGLGIAVSGAALTYLSQFMASTDFGVYTPVIVAGWGVVVNIVRKYLKDNS